MEKLSSAEFFDNPLNVLIDVRAPIEFSKSSFAGSINLPILDNLERQAVGIEYKKHGKQKAIELGKSIVTGENKQKKLQGWIEALKNNPNSVITCLRGGLRSQFAQSILQESTYHLPRLEKGYKGARNYLLGVTKVIIERQIFLPLSGPTGSGKTLLLKKLNQNPVQNSVLDLEALANHRGSAFGYVGAQPSQATFENHLLQAILKNRDQQLTVLEDESRMIGSMCLPENLFFKMRQAPIVFLNTSLKDRIENTIDMYFGDADVEKVFDFFTIALKAISKKLGGKLYADLQKHLIQAKLESLKGDHTANHTWIKILLEQYYDPMYLRSLQKRNPKVVFMGNKSECEDFFKDQIFAGNRILSENQNFPNSKIGNHALKDFNSVVADFK